MFSDFSCAHVLLFTVHYFSLQIQATKFDQTIGEFMIIIDVL